MTVNQEKLRAAWFSILSNGILTGLKLVVGLTMHSVSVIAEAAHSGIDLIAALVAFFSVRESGKPADDTHRYGHGKVESLSGMIEALLIFCAAGYIIFTAVRKLMHGRMEIEELGIGAAVMAVSAVANFLVSGFLYKVAKRTDSLALEADALHLRTDVYTSAGVLGGLIIIKLTGMEIVDPIVAIAVALLIVAAACRLTWNAVQNILDVKLPDDEEDVIRGVLKEHSSSVVEYHKLRTRKSGNVRYIDFHMVVARTTSLEESHRMSHIVVEEIKKLLPNCQILVHTEPCKNECTECEAICPEPHRQPHES
ncbi:MAG: cation diffusion facilitator family transporter [Syntrophobacter sp.]